MNTPTLPELPPAASKPDPSAQLAALMSQPMTGAQTAFVAMSFISSAAGTYHGYRRNNGSIAWALVWGFLGGLFPVVVPAIALAQGFGEKAKRR